MDTPHPRPHSPLGHDNGKDLNVLEQQDRSRSAAAMQSENSRSRRWMKNVTSFIISQWLILGLGILIAIASQVQVPSAQQELKRTIVTYLCISIIFFITGCTLSTQTLLANYRRWKIHVFVQILIFLVTSAIAFGIVSALATKRNITDPGLLVGFIYMGSVATTISSNVIMTRQANGNTALTVVSTTLSNFTGVFITPALVVMYTSVDSWYTRVLPPLSNDFQGIYRRVLMQLGLSMYVPLVIGQVVRHLFSTTCEKVFVRWHGSKLGSVCLLVIIWSTYDQAFATNAFGSLSKVAILILVFINIGLFIVYFLITICLARTWLPRKDVVAICYCVPAKAITMGVPICQNLFANISLRLESQILIPLIVYQLLQLMFGSLLIPVFKDWIAKGERKANPRSNSTVVDHNEAASVDDGNDNDDKKDDRDVS